LKAAQSREIQEGEKRAEEKLTAMALTQKVEATLLGLMGVDGRHMNAQVEKGVVTLRGSVPSVKDREKCEKAVAALEGVKRVDSQILITEYYRFGS
jgi:osmotically-inducible protein OsmY